MFRRAFAAVTLVAALATAAPSVTAQEVPLAQFQVIVLDRERLYADSLFGQRIRTDLEAAGQALATENRRIEAQLVAEEQGLTDRRSEMDPAAFRLAAEEFDTRVEAIREAQARKGRALSEQTDRASSLFFDMAGPVLADVARQLGALVILDRRVVLAAADQVDITQRALRAIDAQIGEGPGLEAMMEGIALQPTPRPERIPAPQDLTPEEATPAQD